MPEAQEEVAVLVEREIERLRLRPLGELRWDDTAHAVRRLVVRTLRIVCGLVLGAVAAWFWSSAGEIMGKPFAVLTLGDVVALIGFGIGLVAFVSWAFAVAFGAGPSKADEEAALRSRAEATVKARMAAKALDEAWRRRPVRRGPFGRVLSVLTDPTLDKRRPWLYGFLVVAGYCLLFGFIGSLFLVSRK